MNSTRVGSRKPLLLVHGLGGGRGSCKPILPALVQSRESATLASNSITVGGRKDRLCLPRQFARARHSPPRISIGSTAAGTSRCEISRPRSQTSFSGAAQDKLSMTQKRTSSANSASLVERLSARSTAPSLRAMHLMSVSLSSSRSGRPLP